VYDMKKDIMDGDTINQERETRSTNFKKAGRGYLIILFLKVTIRHLGRNSEWRGGWLKI
jgi:hypothetical protein